MAVGSQQMLSLLFRFGSWLYLRVFPIPQAHIVLGTIYASWLILWNLQQVPENELPPTTIVVETEEKPNGVGHVDGVVVKKVEVSDPIPGWTRFMLSQPSRKAFTQYAHLALNTLLMAFVLQATFHLELSSWQQDDLTYARVGATYSDAVKIQVRYPHVYDETTALTGTSILKVLWREANVASVEGSWRDGPVLQLSEDHDWVGVAHLTKLWPSYNYEFRLAYPNSTFLPYPAEPLPFRTFPDPRLRSGNKFSFVASSEARFNFPYLPWKAPNAMRGFDMLAHRYLPPVKKHNPIASPTDDELEPAPQPEAQPTVDVYASMVAEAPLGDIPEPVPAAEPTATPGSIFTTTTSTQAAVPTKWAEPEKADVPAFMLLLGDLLQHDAPLPLKTAEIDYAKSMRNVYASSSFRKIYERLPVLHVFNPTVEPAPYHHLLPSLRRMPHNAAPTYQTYSRSVNYGGLNREASYFDFKYGDSSFFVLDTTSYRSDLEDEEAESTLLGHKQVLDLFAWASKVNHTSVFKFVISPVPFSQLWGKSNTGTWADYADERRKVLDVLQYVPNVIIIAGGRHEFAAIEYLGGNILEVVTGPLSSSAVYGAFTALSQSNSPIHTVVKKENVAIPVHGFGPSEQVEIEEVREERGETLLKEYHKGNFKWSKFEVDTTTERPTVTVEMSVDGHPVWSHTVIGKPVRWGVTNAVGAVLSGGLKSVFGKMGFGRLMAGMK